LYLDMFTRYVEPAGPLYGWLLVLLFTIVLTLSFVIWLAIFSYLVIFLPPTTPLAVLWLISIFMIMSWEHSQKTKSRKVEVAKSPEDLYEELLSVYTSIRGGGRQALENRLETLTKRGLNREEAIKKLAEEARLIEKEQSIS